METLSNYQMTLVCGGGSAEANSCSWRNYGKSIVGGAIAGGVTGAIGGSFVPGTGTVLGGTIGLVGGALGGAARHIGTCWW